MAYVETTTKSWGSKIGDGFKAILAGIVLLIIATVLLFWNEGRAVKTGDCINEAEKVHQPLGDISSVNSDLNGKLVYAQGDASTQDIIKDDRFNININALSVNYDIKYYQWVEHVKTEEKKNTGGSTTVTKTYTYSKEWTSKPVSSSSFKESGHDNFTLAYFDTETKYAENVTLGAYKLPEFLYKDISNPKALELNFTEKTYNNLLKYLQTEQNQAKREFINIIGNNKNIIYFGNSESSPQIGDVKLKITHTPTPQAISIVAQLNDNTFSKFTGKSCKDGYEYSSLYLGNLTAAQIFEENRLENTTMTWLLRLLGFIIAFIGFSAFFKLGEALLDVLPFLGNLFAFGTKIISFILALVWSLIIIAIAWFFYRPVLSIILLTIAGLIIFFIYKKRKQMKKNNPNPKKRKSTPIQEELENDEDYLNDEYEEQDENQDDFRTR